MARPSVCVVVTGETMEALRRNRDAVRDADMVELRLDYVDRPDVAAALHGRTLPTIVTCRAASEGGRFAGTEDERRKILETALDLGAEYVDVEHAAGFLPDLIARCGGRRLIVSEHHFTSTPDDVPARIAAMRRTGAEIVKLAVHIDRLEQLLPLLDAADAARNADQGQVLIGMGPAGLASRVLPARFGSRWTYAGDAVAPGQLTITRLRRDFHFNRIAADSALYGVVGRPITHSRSPVMHNAGFAALGIDAVYVPLEARDAEDFVAFARRSGLRGASVTTPFKVSVMPYVDAIDPLAARVGAINTLVVRDGRWFGANTDVEGFLAPLRARVDLPGMRATVLGSGGAARAVAVALADAGARVTVSARRRDAAQLLADAVGGAVGEYPARASSWDVLVNATTVGSNTVPGDPMDGAALDGRVVYDLVYAPADTTLLRRASDAGCTTIGGLEMLVAQAERQFELWTGRLPPTGLFASVSADDFDPQAARGQADLQPQS